MSKTILQILIAIVVLAALYIFFPRYRFIHYKSIIWRCDKLTGEVFMSRGVKGWQKIPSRVEPAKLRSKIMPKQSIQNDIDESQVVWDSDK